MDKLMALQNTDSPRITDGSSIRRCQISGKAIYLEKGAIRCSETIPASCVMPSIRTPIIMISYGGKTNQFKHRDGEVKNEGNLIWTFNRTRPFFVYMNTRFARRIHTSKMALPISSPSPRLDRFGQAMESLYGSFTNIENPAKWTPPPMSGGHRGRYLWTDAFGVINLITMHREYSRCGSGTGDDNRYLIFADSLIQEVHEVLGRQRDGRSRLPGATDANPLGGGLRIGKTEDYGSDADGQYHHYLTVWMFALNRMGRASGDVKYNRLAVQLAKAIHSKFFIDRAAAKPRMIWKMDVNLSEPVVKSEGNLDPIDGYVVFRILQASAIEAGDGEILAEEIGDYKRTMDRKGEHFVSSDTLDLGMTLWTAHWFCATEDWAADLTKKCFDQICQSFSFRRLETNIERGCQLTI